MFYVPCVYFQCSLFHVPCIFYVLCSMLQYTVHVLCYIYLYTFFLRVLWHVLRLCDLCSMFSVLCFIVWSVVLWLIVLSSMFWVCSMVYGQCSLALFHIMNRNCLLAYIISACQWKSTVSIYLYI
jgi:hypothetical protein